MITQIPWRNKWGKNMLRNSSYSAILVCLFIATSAFATNYNIVLDPSVDCTINGTSELGTDEHFYFVTRSSGTATFTVNRGNTGGYLKLYSDTGTLLAQDTKSWSGSPSITYSLSFGKKYELVFDEYLNFTGSYVATFNLPDQQMSLAINASDADQDRNFGPFDIFPSYACDYWDFTTQASGPIEIVTADYDNKIGFDTDLYVYRLYNGAWHLAYVDNTSGDGSISIPAFMDPGTHLCFVVRANGGPGRYTVSLKAPVKPTPPGIIYPPYRQTGVERKPTFYAAAFNDYDAGDTHLQTRWQLSNDSGFTSLVWDYIDTDSDKRKQLYPGVLDWGKKYYLRVRYADNYGNWSDWFPTPSSFGGVWYFTTEEYPKFTVTSPNGGESWERGSTHNITWDWVGNPGPYVKIEVYKGSSLYSTITTSTTNDGSYSWTIPSGTAYAIGSNYWIKITSTEPTGWYDESDNYFSIIAPPSITVTSPNGGESWERGSTHNVTWSSAGAAGSDVQIELYKGGSPYRGIISSTPNNGSYSWTILSSETAGSDYKIKVTSTSDSSYYDYSDSDFSITAPPGTLQFKSSTYTVAENAGSVRIYVSRTGGSYGTASVNYATANSTATAGSDYTTKSGILSRADGDSSDKYFDVSITDDSTPEGDETFTANLSGASGASLGSPSQTTVTISELYTLTTDRGWQIERYDFNNSSFYPYPSEVPVQNLPFAEQWHVSGNTVKTGDVDGDGALELVTSDGSNLYVYNGSGQLEWQMPVVGNLNILADVTDDGIPEILISRKEGSTGNIKAYSGSGPAAPVKTFTTSVDVSYGDVTARGVSDLDGDGVHELIAMKGAAWVQGRGVVVFNCETTNELWYHDIGPFVPYPAVGDVTGLLTNMEILHGSSGPYNGVTGADGSNDWSCYAFLLNANGSSLWRKQFEGSGFVNASVGLCNVIGDNRLDIITTSFSHGWNFWDGSLGRVYILDPTTGEPMSGYEHSFSTSVWLGGLADLDGDGKVEILINKKNGATQTGSIVALSPTSGLPVIHEFPVPGSMLDVLFINDIDGDGNPEVVVKGQPANGSANTFYVLDNNLNLLWQMKLGGNFGGAIVSDLDDDGMNEIIIENAGTILVFKGTSSPALQLTITKCTVKAGKYDSEDSITISGTIGVTPAEFIGNNVEVNIGGVYLEEIPASLFKAKNGKYSYAYRIPRNGEGGITSLVIDTNKHKFTFQAKKVDLTCLKCPFDLEIQISDYWGKGTADESIVNGKRFIPIQLMSGWEDDLQVHAIKVKAGKKPSTDALTVKGGIAFGNMPNSISSNVVLKVGNQTFTIPAGSFNLSGNSGLKYVCKNAQVLEGGIANATFDFSKCTFVISVKNTTINTKYDQVEMNLTLGSYSEEVKVVLGC
jgi:hypothetical protein